MEVEGHTSGAQGESCRDGFWLIWGGGQRPCPRGLPPGGLVGRWASAPHTAMKNQSTRRASFALALLAPSQKNRPSETRDLHWEPSCVVGLWSTEGSCPILLLAKRQGDAHRLVMLGRYLEEGWKRGSWGPDTLWRAPSGGKKSPAWMKEWLWKARTKPAAASLPHPGWQGCTSVARMRQRALWKICMEKSLTLFLVDYTAFSFLQCLIIQDYSMFSSF